jgi:hypothetical protein
MNPHNIVTIHGHIWYYGVAVYDLNYLWVIAYHFPPGHGLVYWSLHNWL